MALLKEWYEKKELILYARAQGFSATEELLKDWIEKGLMGQANQNRSLGRGRGSVAIYSQRQLDLFLMLLRHRQREQNKIHIGHLCNIPVWKWLYWGDMSGVALKQVRDAMKTWVKFRKKLPASKIRKDATGLVKLIEGPNASGRRALIEKLTKAGTLRKDLDEETLWGDLDFVVNEHAYSENKPRGTVKKMFANRVYISTMIPLRFKALQNYEAIGQLPDELWEWARTLLLVTVWQSLSIQPDLAADPEWGHLFPPQTVDGLCESSCYYLLTILGIAQQDQFASGEEGYLLYLNPHVWQRGEASSLIQTRMVIPNGSNTPHLHTDIMITHQGGKYPFSFALPIAEIASPVITTGLWNYIV